MYYKIAWDRPTAGFKQAPEVPAVFVRAIRLKTTPITASKPYLVGTRRASFTIRITNTNKKVQTTSILKAFPGETFGLKITYSASGIDPLI